MILLQQLTRGDKNKKMYHNLTLYYYYTIYMILSDVNVPAALRYTQLTIFNFKFNICLGKY